MRDRARATDVKNKFGHNAGTACRADRYREKQEAVAVMMSMTESALAEM